MAIGRVWHVCRSSRLRGHEPSQEVASLGEEKARARFEAGRSQRAYASPSADDCFLFHLRRTRSTECHGLKLSSGRFELPARRESSLRVFGFSNGRSSSSPRLPFIGREPIGMPSSRSFLFVCWFTSSIASKRRLGVSPGEVGTMSKRHIQTVRDFLKKRSF